MHIASCQINDKFQGWLGTSNWPNFIAKVETKYLGIFKVHLICIEVSKWTKIDVANALAEKKAKWANIIPSPPKPN